MSAPHSILVADIGGTNARFAIAIPDDGPMGFTLKHQQNFRAEDFDNLLGAINAYGEYLPIPMPEQACFAVAAQPSNGVYHFTNSPWILDSEEIKTALSLDTMMVVNDFQAMTSGARFMQDKDRLLVRDGIADAEAPIIVLGPGTGLGLGLLVPCGDRVRIIATEGGHAAFAPQTEEEIEILRLIMREHKTVLFEHLLSGRGLVNIHRALCVLADKPRVSLRPSDITAAAYGDDYPIAKKAVNVFCAVLGSFAGNVAVTTGARGGVILAGGILPKIADVFLKSDFNARFETKGPHENYLANVPVYLLTSEATALIGAAHLIGNA
ncbi:MAG: glucokinase [Robiginitomaculum sp.]|nr:glucokinase [Robiginitomaculum sp.]MDQ7077042.1 glucokinase [Robiginitomaculum sp.]